MSFAACVGRLEREVLGGDGSPIEPFLTGFHQDAILPFRPGARLGALGGAGRGRLGRIHRRGSERGGSRVGNGAVV